MGYVRVDDSLPTGKKVMRIEKRYRMASLGVWLSMLSYCSAHLSDGFVPMDVATSAGTPATLGRLSEVGLLKAEPDGYKVCAYLDWNKSKAEIRAIQQQKREAGKKGGLVKGTSKSQAGAKSSLNPTATAYTTASAKKKNTYVPEFERWWKTYPRKGDKLRASKAFAKVLEDLPAAEIERCTKLYAVSVEYTEERYIRLPATFLNNLDPAEYVAEDESWLDTLNP